MNYTTFIITRFRQRRIDPNNVINNKYVKSFDLEHRFKMFEKYCYPSIMNQTDKNFIWMTISSKSIITKKDIDRIKSYKEIHHIFLEPEEDDDWINVIKRNIKERIQKDSKKVITIRLDNDDGLAKSYIKTIKECADTCDKDTVMICPTGIQYVEKTNTAYKWYKQYCNAFIGLVEDVNNLETVYRDGHTNMPRYYDTKWVINYIGWLQVIHGKNLRNNLRTADKITIEKMKEHIHL